MHFELALSRMRLYIDEDAMDNDFVEALRVRGITVVTAMDAGLPGKPDEEQLSFATDCGCTPT